MKLLHIDSSILGANSVSRGLTAEIVARQKALHPGLEVSYLDLAERTPQHLSPAHIGALFGHPPADQAVVADIAAAAPFIDDLFAADIIVIGAPMYNFTLPSQLKAWIDRIAVAGKTFHYTAAGPEGLAGGKRVIVASSRGGVYSTGPAAGLDFQENYLRALLGFLGIDDVQFIRAEGVNMSAEHKVKAIASAHHSISSLATKAA